jgi:hypothetical protein
MVMLGMLAVLVVLVEVVMDLAKVEREVLEHQTLAAVVVDQDMVLVMVLALMVVLVFVSYLFVLMVMHQEFQNNLTPFQK